MLDSGNRDGGKTSVQDVFDSPLVYEKSPSQTQKGHKLDLYFGNTTAGRLYLYESLDFNENFKLKEIFAIAGTSKQIVMPKSFDLPQTYNAYRWRLTSSGGTNDPWIMYRNDLFEQPMGIGKNQ